MATSIGGVLTGLGADLIIIDDPQKPSDAMSESRRVACNEWFDGALYTRLNDKTTGGERGNDKFMSIGSPRRRSTPPWREGIELDL